MFATVEGVPWANLRGPYGPVPEMPLRLQALAYGNSDVAHEALCWIGNNTIHQGTRWQSTAAVIPFLFELVDAPRTSWRAEIAWLLLSLAVDEISPFFPAGFDPDKYFAEASKIVLDPEVVEGIWKIQDWDLLSDAQWEIANQLPLRWHFDAYQATERGVVSFMRLVTDADPQVRLVACRALAYFPRAARESLLCVRHSAFKETDPYLLANCLMTLGLLARYTKDVSDAPWLERKLGVDVPWIVRVMAALALGTIVGAAVSNEALSVLVDATEADLNIVADHTTRLRLNSSLLGYVWQPLHSLGL